MPLFHVHGLVASTLATLATGGTVVVPGKFSPLSFWRVARDHGATWYSAVPTIHQLLLARVEAGRAAAGRRREAALHPLVQRVAAAAGHARSRGGVRRAGARGLRHDRGRAPDGVESAAAGAAAAGIGRAAAPTCSISIMDAEGHAPGRRRARRGRASRARTSSPGYENNPEANATSFFDGWFRTGDQGFLDENGYLTLAGRLKELINRGGEKISPREIDEVLLDASGGRRGRVLRRAAPDVGRRSRGGRRVAASDAGDARRSCSRTARSGWPTSSGRSRFTSPTRFRARPPARFSGASSRRRSRRKPS